MAEVAFTLSSEEVEAEIEAEAEGAVLAADADANAEAGAVSVFRALSELTVLLRVPRRVRSALAVSAAGVDGLDMDSSKESSCMSRMPMRCGEVSFLRSRVPKLRSYEETRVRTDARSAPFPSRVTSSGSAAQHQRQI